MSVAVLLVVGGLLSLALSRMAKRRIMSRAWMVDNDRRRWTAGEDGVCWRWPVKGGKL